MNDEERRCECHLEAQRALHKTPRHRYKASERLTASGPVVSRPASASSHDDGEKPDDTNDDGCGRRPCRER